MPAMGSKLRTGRRPRRIAFEPTDVPLNLRGPNNGKGTVGIYLQPGTQSCRLVGWKAIAQWLGVGHVVGVASGTEAITLALNALGVQGSRNSFGDLTSIQRVWPRVQRWWRGPWSLQFDDQERCE